MKKIILYTSAFASLLLTGALAQGTEQAINISLPTIDLKVQKLNFKTVYSQLKSEPVIISGVTMREGTNTITVPKGRGTLTFMKRNEFFSNVIFTDAAGKTSRLVPIIGASSALKPTCQFPIPEASFGTTGIGLSICRASVTPGNSGLFKVSLLLPENKKSEDKK
jgi:hypothetical protein